MAIHAQPTPLSDPCLEPFLQPSFDPAAYFNITLPTLTLSGTTTTTPNPSRRPSASSKPSTATLADLSTTTQTLLSTLNAQTTRLSNTLTQLTDDILRSGARLAYQVDLLRGETLTLSETLSTTLAPALRNFLPETLPAPSETAQEQEQEQDKAPNVPPPPHITQLRTLTQVRARLDSVIHVFGDAMQWTLPPSEVSLGSSLISVSAPEPGSEGHGREEKGREFAEKLRSEIGELVAGEEGVVAATARIQALRDLAVVWKGTAEEKARVRFVEGLVRLAEEKQKGLESGKGAQKATGRRRQSSAAGQAAKASTGTSGTGSGGFLENLSRMRGNF